MLILIIYSPKPNHHCLLTLNQTENPPARLARTLQIEAKLGWKTRTQCSSRRSQCPQCHVIVTVACHVDTGFLVKVALHWWELHRYL